MSWIKKWISAFLVFFDENFMYETAPEYRIYTVTFFDKDLDTGEQTEFSVDVNADCEDRAQEMATESVQRCLSGTRHVYTFKSVTVSNKY